MQENQNRPMDGGKGGGYGFCPYCMSRVPDGENCPVCGLTMGTYKPAPHHLPPGTVLAGRYLVGRVLGEGGFGITYVGCDLRLEMKVAIKEYFPVDSVSRNSKASLTVTVHSHSVAQDFDKGVRRFLTEARTMGRMDKLPEIVGVKDFFEANGTAYIVMEYVDGTDFQTLVRQKGGRILPEELFPMIRPLFGALTAMHKAGLVHRDISPDNLMMESGKIRLLDFGCTRETSGTQETFTIALKQGFGPIEQYQGKGQGPWTDVYALSATIYYCLTGRRPPQALDRMLEDGLVPPQSLGVPITDRQQEALLKGMAVNPKERYQSMEELYTGLYGIDGSSSEKPGKETDVHGTSPIVPPAPARQSDPSPEEPAQVRTGEQERRPKERTQTGKPDQPAEEGPDRAEEPRPDRESEEVPAHSAHSRRTLYLGIAAVAVAIVLILVVILCMTLGSRSGSASDEPGAGRESFADSEEEGTPDEAPTGQGTSADSREEQPLGDDRQWLLDAGVTSNPRGWSVAVWDGGSEEELTAYLEDPTVDAVILRFGNGEVHVSAGLDICKPVKLEANTLDVLGWMTVSGNGLLWVEGSLYANDGLIRVCDGGRICLAEEGQMDSERLWLQDVGELEVLSPDARVVLGGTEYQGTDWTSSDAFLALDPDAYFENAIHVNTEEELDAALQSGEAVVIDANLSLPELETSTPVKISEHVTVTMTGEGWCVDAASEGSILVIEGVLAGVLYTSDGLQDSPEQSYTILNEGLLDVGDLRLWTQGNLFNYGAMNWDGEVCGGTVYNLGSMRSPGGRYEDSPRYYFGNGGTDLYTTLYNYGEWTLDGQNSEGETVRLFNRMLNTGTLILEGDARFENDSVIDNWGTIEFRSDEACLINNGELRNDYAKSTLIGGENSISPDSCGVILYSETSRVDLPDLPGKGLFFDQYESGGVFVDTYEELQNALDDASCPEVVLVRDITCPGDLTVTGKTLVVQDGICLTVSGALTIGEDGALFLKAGILDLGDALVLQDNGAALLDNYTREPFSDLNLNLRLESPDSRLVCVPCWNLSGAELEITGTLVCSNGLNLTDCSVTMSGGTSDDEEALLFSAGDILMYGCSVELGSGSRLRLVQGTWRINSNTVVTARDGSVMEAEPEAM